MELREAIARVFADFSGSQTIWDDHEAAAEKVLAIPEIRDAQERIKQLEQEIDAMDGDMREMGYGD